MSRAKSNDNVPVDEMLLAKMVQNAKALGLQPTKGAAYRDERGESCSAADAKACCAVGAGWLSPDSNEEANVYDYIPLGNDDQASPWQPHFSKHDGETIGHAFQLAMEDEQ